MLWLPGHSDIPGNCDADELVRAGTTTEEIYMHLATCRHLINKNVIDIAKSR